MEPSTSFAYPTDHQADLLRDYFKAAYGKNLTGPEIEWLGGVVSDFLAWSQNNCSKREARVAGLRMLRLLSAIDEAMVDSRCPERTWNEIAYVLELPRISINHVTQAELAASYGLTTAGLGKSVRNFLSRLKVRDVI